MYHGKLLRTVGTTQVFSQSRSRQQMEWNSSWKYYHVRWYQNTNFFWMIICFWKMIHTWIHWCTFKHEGSTISKWIRWKCKKSMSNSIKHVTRERHCKRGTLTSRSKGDHIRYKYDLWTFQNKFHRWAMWIIHSLMQNI